MPPFSKPPWGCGEWQKIQNGDDLKKYLLQMSQADKFRTAALHFKIIIIL